MPAESHVAEPADLWPRETRVFTPTRGIRVFVGIAAAMVLFASWSTAPDGWVTLAPVNLLLAGAWLESVYARIEVEPTSLRLRSLRGDRTFNREELGEAVAHQLPRRQHSRTDPGVNLSVRLHGDRFGMRLTGVLWPRQTLHELSRIVGATGVHSPSFRELEANYPGSTRLWNRQMWVPALAIFGYIWVSSQYAPLLFG